MIQEQYGSTFEIINYKFYQMIEPTLLLTYLEGSSPLQYAIKVSVKFEDDGVMLLSHLGVPEEPYEDSIFLIEVVTDPDSGVEELVIDLGTIPLDPTVSEVEVRLLDDQSNELGRNKIRAEEAQKESRPIEFDR